jgi:hypothetical protein
VNPHYRGTAVTLYGGRSSFITTHLAPVPEASINFEEIGGKTVTTFLIGVVLAGFLFNPPFALARVARR